VKILDAFLENATLLEISGADIISQFEPHQGSYAILTFLGFQLDDETWTLSKSDISFLTSQKEKFQKIIDSSRNFSIILVKLIFRF
jgi:hypothetical protein